MATQLDFIQEACRLNNLGVMHLSHQDAASAVKAFKTSLSIMEGVAGKADSADMCSSTANKCLSCPSAVIAGLEDSFFIYNRALLLDPAFAQTDLAFANAVILFNLALTFHQRGKALGQLPKLQKALYLYDVSTKLIADMSSSAGALSLAALNNQAQILFALGEYSRGRELLDRVQSLAEQVPTPAEDDASSTFARYHFDEMYLNVTVSQPPTTAPSA
jgi:tetratricopeptide (TPR) repeat protein